MLLKKRILVFGVMAGVLTLAMVVAFSLAANTYKSRLEPAISKAAGMEVSIGGRTSVGFIPGFHITLNDVHFRNRGSEVLSAKSIAVRMNLFRLLRRELRLGGITLKQARIYIERGQNGRYNYEPMEEHKDPRPAIDLPGISLSDGTLVYLDRQSGAGLELDDCSMDARDLRHPGGERANFLRQLSLTAELACKEVRTKRLTVSDLRITVDGQRGIFMLEPVTMRLFSGNGSGSIRMDHTGSVPKVRLRYVLARFHIEDYFKSLSPKKIADGVMDFSTDLTMQGASRDELRRTTNGSVDLKGNKLALYGTNLDRELAQYEQSQNFNLVDLSAFFLAGPVGLALTKGRDFGSLLQRSGGSTAIRTLVSTWRLQNGVAKARDVALATNENRLALQG
ncbi:MAG: AsmA family protein, partial [Nevskiales bacterium]